MQHRERRVDNAGDAMANAQILVVEDEKIVAKDIQNTLEGLGYAVPAVASYGEEAIEVTAETQPDLVLMDIVLKGELDGVEAAEQIRTRFDIPVVYLTAFSDEETLQRAKITEPYGYIVKPFSDRELHINIEIALYKHEMQKKLKESERWLSTTLKSIGDAVIASDTEGWVTFVNSSAEALTGWKREALGNELTEVLNIFGQETRIVGERLATQALREGALVRQSDKTMLRAKDGKQVPIEISAAPIRGGNGAIIGVVLAFKDISERKRLEQGIRNEKLRAEAIIEYMADGLVMLDRDGRVVSINPAAQRMLRIDATEVLGKLITEEGSPPGLRALDLTVGKTKPALDGGDGMGVIENEITLDHPPLSHTLKVVSSPVVDSMGLLLGEVTLLHDITRERESEQAKDELLFTVSNELRTPVFSIQGILELILDDKVPGEEKRKHYLELAYRQSKGSGNLLDELLWQPHAWMWANSKSAKRP